MPAASTVIMAAGGSSMAITALATYMQSEAQAKQANAQLRLKQLQADEIEKRAKLKEQEMVRFGDKLSSAQRLRGATLSQIQESASQLESQIYEANRDAYWEAGMTRMGADFEHAAADDARNAGILSGIGSIIGQAGKIAGSMGGATGAPTSLKLKG